MYRRPQITKYFSKDVLNNIENGSFRFGTLSEYRSQEHEGERFSDTREGISEIGIFPSGGHIEQAKIGSNTFTNIQIVNCGTPIAIHQSFNAYVFCASVGGYSKKHHERMLRGETNGDEEKYKGNANLTHYAIIDLEKFIIAIREVVARNEIWAANLEHPICIQHREVSYGETQTDIQVGTKFNIPQDGISYDQYIKTIFTKPKKFKLENEYRIVIQPNAPMLLGDTDLAYILQHKLLRRSIEKIGEY